MLKEHQFYVYHDGPNVMARSGNAKPVVARVCKSPQAAHDVVQEVVNPEGRDAKFYRVMKDGVVVSDLGFLDPRFQAAISKNCEAFVKAAYAKAS